MFFSPLNLATTLQVGVKHVGIFQDLLLKVFFCERIEMCCSLFDYVNNACLIHIMYSYFCCRFPQTEFQATTAAENYQTEDPCIGEHNCVQNSLLSLDVHFLQQI